MSIWYDGSNLNMYNGDSGIVTFFGLPTDKTYRAYFSVKSIVDNTIVFETSSDVFIYWGDVDGVAIEKNYGETEEQYQARCRELEKEGQAFEYGKAEIFISPDYSALLSVSKGKLENKYYFGLKVCNANEDIEDTVIPRVVYDEETGVPTFVDPPYLIVRPKYTEGTLAYDLSSCEIDIKNPKDYGIQTIISAGKNVVLEPGDVITALPLVDIDTYSLKHNDVLAYDKELGKIINKPFDDILEEEMLTREDFMNKINLTKVNDWLYSVEYNDIDYDYADYYAKTHYLPTGKCSSCRKGNFYGRNYDWFYGYSESFFIRVSATEDRHASIGIGAGIKRLTKDMVESGNYNTEYKLLPFLTLDGINDCGVVCNSNVTATGDNPDDPLNEYPAIINRTTGTNPDSPISVNVMMLPRMILDKAGSVEEAIQLIKSWNIYACFNKFDTELHFMIADPERTIIVEFVKNEVKIIEDWEKYKPIMTNFYIYGWDGDTSNIIMQTAKEEATELNKTVTRHPAGLERYKILYDGLNEVDSVESMKTLMDKVYYRVGTYGRDVSPFWYTEYVGVYPSGDFRVDTDIDDEAFRGAIERTIAIKEEEDRTGTRTNMSWQTVSQSIYDIEHKSVTVTVQEGTEESVTFTLE